MCAPPTPPTPIPPVSPRSAGPPHPSHDPRALPQARACSVNEGDSSRAAPGRRWRARCALRKLAMLHAAADLSDLRPPKATPATRLEALKGDRAGQHSLRINDQWRLCFTWKGGDAYDVEIVDYH